MKTLKHLYRTGKGPVFTVQLIAGAAWPFFTSGIGGPLVVLISAIIYGGLALVYGMAEAHRQKMLKELWYQAARQTNHNSGETGQFTDKKASDFAIDKLKVDLERLDRIPARATFIFSFKGKEIKYLPE